MTNPETWVAVSFLLFVGLLVYFGVPRKLIRALDSRADAIAKELEEARRLRVEAEAVLADYRRKARAAEAEAANIIAQAEREAEAYGRETRAAFEEMLNRRMKSAEEKIARAEAKALEEIRAQAAELAVATAEKLIRRKMSGKLADELVTTGIDRVKKRLH